MIGKEDSVPGVRMVNAQGEQKSLRDFKGKVLFYFYPKDDTPGCTKQACNLRDNFAQLKKAGITIVGISPDNKESHKKFIAKHDLPFELLVDEDHKLAEAFGVWQEKNMYGNKYFGIKRTSFLADNGKIVAVIDKVKVGEHADQVLAAFNISKK